LGVAFRRPVDCCSLLPGPVADLLQPATAAIFYFRATATLVCELDPRHFRIDKNRDLVHGRDCLDGGGSRRIEPEKICLGAAMSYESVARNCRAGLGRDVGVGLRKGAASLEIATHVVDRSIVDPSQNCLDVRLDQSTNR